MAFKKIARKSLNSNIKIVHLTTFSKVKPASDKRDCMFCITWCVAASMFSVTKFPESGLMGTWPLMYKVSFTSIAGEYGPMGGGAPGILNDFFVINIGLKIIIKSFILFCTFAK
jgi:hypothetical protein